MVLLLLAILVPPGSVRVRITFFVVLLALALAPTFVTGAVRGTSGVV